MRGHMNIFRLFVGPRSASACPCQQPGAASAVGCLMGFYGFVAFLSHFIVGGTCFFGF